MNNPLPYHICRARVRASEAWAKADALFDVQLDEYIRGKREDIDWDMIEELQKTAIYLQDLAQTMSNNWHSRPLHLHSTNIATIHRTARQLSEFQDTHPRPEYN